MTKMNEPCHFLILSAVASCRSNCCNDSFIMTHLLELNMLQPGSLNGLVFVRLHKEQATIRIFLIRALTIYNCLRILLLSSSARAHIRPNTHARTYKHKQMHTHLHKDSLIHTHTHSYIQGNHNHPHTGPHSHPQPHPQPHPHPHT